MTQQKLSPQRYPRLPSGRLTTSQLESQNEQRSERERVSQLAHSEATDLKRGWVAEKPKKASAEHGRECQKRHPGDRPEMPRQPQ